MVTLCLNAESRISSIYDHRKFMKKVQVAFRETSWEQQFIMKSSRQNREQQIQQRGFNRGPSITHTHTVFVSHQSLEFGTRLSYEVWYGVWFHVLPAGFAPHLHKQTVYLHFTSSAGILFGL